MSLLLGLAVLLALAPPPSPPQGPGPRGERRAVEEAARMVDAYIVSNLQESLGLTDEQFVKLLPLVKRLQGERRQHVRERARALRELRRLLESGTATEAQVVDQLREVKRAETEGPDRVRKTSEAIDDALSPIQQAKFRVLEADVERRIREILRRVHRQRRPGAPAAPDVP